MNGIKETMTDVVEDIATRPIQEGKWTKALENQTAKIPSVFFLNLAIGSIALSAAVKLFKKRDDTTGNFIGLWAPTFLLLGLYNKLVKLEGNDRRTPL